MKKTACSMMIGLLLIFSLILSPLPVTASSENHPPPSSQNTFRVLDISERTYDDGPAIAVLLSHPLDVRGRHDTHLRISDDRTMLKSAWVASEDGRTLWFPHVEPETAYSVSVLESLTAADGRQLGKRVSKAITTRKIVPLVSFASDGFILPEALGKGLPIVSVNVPSVDVEFFRLSQKGLINFVNWRRMTGTKDYYELSDLKDYGEIVYSGRFDFDIPKNRRKVFYIPVKEIDALKQTGVYLAVMRRPGEYDYSYQTAYFLVTDIGLQLRTYRENAVVLASSLKTGKPLSGVRLTFYNNKGKPVGDGVTGSEGDYRSPRKLSDKIRMITAEHQGQFGVLPLRMPSLDMSEFDLGKRAWHQREIFTYSPRNIYRPGETVTVSALLRDDDGKPVEVLPLKARLMRPDGKKAKEFNWHSTDLGRPDTHYYQTSFTLPPDAPTGLWELNIRDIPSRKTPTGVFTFHVEEFLPERMKLELSAGPELPGMEESLTVNVNGQYLYGAPAAGNTVTARVSVKPSREPFAMHKGYRFGDVEDLDYRDYWELEEQDLDKQGLAALAVESRWKGMKSPLEIRTTVDLFETGGRPVTRAVRRTVWPAEPLIGIRPLFDAEKSTEEGPVSFEVIRVLRNGKMAQASDLIVNLTREDRDYYWEYSESSGWRYKYTQKNYLFLTDQVKTDGKKPAPFSLHLKRGQYVLSISDPESNTKTSMRFRVGYWWHQEDSRTARPDKVVLALDKPAYRAGDIIRLAITPPHSGEAVVMVEGNTLLWMKRLPVSAKGTEVEIPMLAGWTSHNLYISTVVFRPGDAKEKITPNRAVGLVHLPLDRSDRHLGIAIDAPEKARSEGAMKVGLTLDAGVAGAPEKVFVTLAAVDVGILSITDFKTPDPLGYFFGKRRYGVNATDIYNRVIEDMDGNMAALKYGGDADLAGGKRPENKVKLLSLFYGPVAFNDAGKAEITVDLPDFNGRLRLMAVAFSADCFGSAEKEVTVAAPIVTQLAMPRFLAPGDESMLTLDVHNMSGAAAKGAVTMSAEGPLSVIRDANQTISLADGEKTTLRFPVKADADYGTAAISMKLAADDIHLSRSWNLAVRPGYPGIARKVFKIMAADETFTLDPALAEDLIPATAEGHLKISTRLPLDIRNAVKGLIGYPYGCLEQTTSRAYPLLFATPEQIACFHLPAITPEERVKRLDESVSRLSSMQLASGGFGLWNRTSPETAWLTVYVADFLLTARDRGVSVPANMLDNALERLETYLKKEAPLNQYMDNNKRGHLQFAIRSYAGYVLARLNRAPLGSLRPLYDHHSGDAASCLPLVHIGMALKMMGDEKRGAEALEKAMDKRPDRYGYWGDYSSLIRDLALSIALMTEHKSDQVKGVDTLLNDLEKALHQRRWFSTQERYAIFKAGMALAQSDHQPWQGKLIVAGKETALDRKADFLAELTAEEMAKGVSFISRTPGRLYISAVVDGYTQTPPVRDDSRIFIERKLYDMKGKPVNRTTFYVGELMLVHLKVRAKEWIPDGLLADMLPAGFEAENQNLKHSFKLDDVKINGESIWRLKDSTDVLYEEYRDDRYVAAAPLSNYSEVHLFYPVRVVSPGTFSVPPAFAESMYRPEIRGIGEAKPVIKVLNERPKKKKTK